MRLAAVRASAHVGENRPDRSADARCVCLTCEVPPPPPPPPQKQQQPKPKDKEGGSAPKNIKSEATPVVAPKPRIETPPIQPIAASETPRQGAAPTQGASDVRGPGTGAGGVGTGTGSGIGGNGPGGGGGMAVPAGLIRGITGPRLPASGAGQLAARRNHLPEVTDRSQRAAQPMRRHARRSATPRATSGPAP